MDTFEILAPAGSADALTAAVRSGAAAVYLGTDAFNARQHAENFAGDALKDAVAYCHVRGVKVYLTLNTLIRENEFNTALQVAKRAQEYGVDALILQDVGLARVLREMLPEMPLHASTQLSCHTPDGVRFLRDNGFSRVVLSREMNAREIADCAGLGCELEVFVHGALCMCVSGQCYLSAMLGGRSGNRGLCAQPCRLPFSVEGTADLTGGYALSLKDQSLTEYIPQMIKAGIFSFKIEGRMKRPEYVAAAVTACCQAAKGLPVSAQMLEDLKAVFSRSGFTDGYYTDARGTAMFGIRSKEDVTRTATVLKGLAALYQKERQSVVVTMHLKAAVGQAVTLTVSDGNGHTVTVCGDTCEAAHTAASVTEKVVAQLEKTGGTPFKATAFASLGEGVMLPVSAVNALRREALERLEVARSTVKRRPVNEFVQTEKKPLTSISFKRLVRLQTWQQYSKALCDATVVLPLHTPLTFLEELQRVHTGGFGVEIPRGIFGGTAVVSQQLQRSKAAGAAFVLCGNVNALEAAKETGLPIVGGFGMNITNAQAVGFYAENGVSALTLSPELSFGQMRFAQKSAVPCGVLCYGRLPLMLTRNCPRHAAGGDCATCKDAALIDRKNVRFPVICAGGCSELLNSVPLYWGDKRDELPKGAFELYHFTDEDAARVAQILEMYKNGAPADVSVTRGMCRKGVE